MSAPEHVMWGLHNRFEYVRDLDGGHSHVLLCMERGTCELYVIKVYDMRQLTSTEITRVYREGNALCHLRGDQNFAQIKHWVIEQDYMFLVMEYCPYGSLYDCVRNVVVNKMECMMRLARRMADAVCALHRRGLVHRDIKLENFFVRGPFELCLGDFEYVTVNRNCRIRSRLGSRLYAAPELLNPDTERIETDKLDVYSLGVAFYAMLSFQFPFKGDDPDSLLVYRRDHPAGEPIPDSVPAPMARLIGKMMRLNPRERVNMEYVVKKRHYKFK